MTIRQSIIAMVLIVAAASYGRYAWADDDLAHKQPDSQESAFLRDSVQSDVLQERLGQYAADHAATDEVKALGKKLASNHQQNREEIQQFAKDHRLNLMHHDADLTLEQKATYDRLIGKPGRDFDKEYTALVIIDDQSLIAMYERERDHAGDVFVREFAGKVVPELKEQLKMAEDAQKVANAG
jgi:predicted outer membrane protein